MLMMEYQRLLSSVRPLLLIICLPAAAWVVLAAADVVAPPPPPPLVAHRPDCPSRCGDVDIPYPFGIGDQCAINPDFILDCTRDVNGTEMRPFLHSFEVTSISVPDAKAWIKMFISWGVCYDSTTRRYEESTWGANFTYSPFRFSQDNKIFVVGCYSLAYITTEYLWKGNFFDRWFDQWLRKKRLKSFRSHASHLPPHTPRTLAEVARGTCSLPCLSSMPLFNHRCWSSLDPRRHEYSIGCLSQCYNEAINTSSCSPGSGCCDAEVPVGMGYLWPYFNYNYTDCSYAVVMEAKEFRYLTTYRNSTIAFWDAYNGTVPVVMDWIITWSTCEDAKTNLSSYACISDNSECVNTTNGNGPRGENAYRCKCLDGYQGNPYVKGGCTDIDECLQNNTTNTCMSIGATCQNTEGNYTCLCPPGESMMDSMCMANHKSSSWLIPVVGTSVGLVVLFFTTTCACLIHQRRKLQHIKQIYFQQHGGMLLFEEIKSQQGSIVFEIFSEAALQEATDGFNEQRVLGHGGHGTVYKGLLKGNVEVAVKRCTSIDEQHRKEFGKEMLILSQINHRNIVKLLGCCLEVQVPMLVYEFIPNGTLFQLIHGNHGRHISLAARVQIAHQSAEALAYLHSWASPPILHGDVKSSNILIDSDYTAKVSDFGASILAPTDESQFVTLVQGTCGYLDPEYMQTCHLTDKSDVYSFGVVLLELLTRKKPFNLDAPDDEKSLAMRFISVTKRGKLEEILDYRLKDDENMGFLKEIAELAKHCLEISGANRPSMREVSERLDRLRRVMQHPWAQQNLEEMESLLGESSLASCEIAITGNLSIEKKAAMSLAVGR